MGQDPNKLQLALRKPLASQKEQAMAVDQVPKAKQMKKPAVNPAGEETETVAKNVIRREVTDLFMAKLGKSVS